MDLSCVIISTVSKWTETRFHLSLVTKKYHWVRTKWFLSLWYIGCKPCTYLESRLVLSPNGSKWASTWASSPRSTIRCVQNDYWAYGTFGANRAPQTDRNELPPEPRHLGVPSGASKIISNPMVRLSKPCTYLARTLTPSSNGPKPDLTWPMSPTGSIGCVQNDFQVYGMFSAMRQYLHYIQIVRNEPPLEPRQLGVPSGASKIISNRMVHLAQTLHLSCSDTNIVMEQTKIRFHMSHITWSSIGFVQNDFQAYGTFGSNRAPILHRH
jgi:hypothetical protein